MMHETEVRQLRREVVRRYSPPARTAVESRFADYLATLFPAQRDIVHCWDERLAVKGTRRAGKSKMLPAKLLAADERWPGTVIYYLHPDGGTRAEETLMGPDINLEGIIADYGLPWRYNANKRTFFHLETRSEIRARGADDVREARKYRGDKVSLVVTEETQNFPAPILKALVDDHLGPALADVTGQWMSIGTVGDVCAGPWYDITRNEDAESEAQRAPGWTVFDWDVLNNPHMQRQAARIIAKRLAGFTEKTEAELAALLLESGPQGRAIVEAIAAADPSTLREWFGRWVNDSAALFYAFDARRNLYDGQLPRGHVWLYFLGGDLGTGDAYAHHVWAVSRTHPVAYEVESYERSGLHAGQWRTEYEAARRRWRPVKCVVDEGGLGKGVADEWRSLGIPVEPAEKTRKHAAATTLNGELREGKAKLLANPVSKDVSPCKQDVSGGVTASTMAALRKSPKQTPGKPPAEDPTQANHASDAALYAHRAAMRYLGRDDKPAEEKTREKAAEDAIEAEMERRGRQRLNQRNQELDAW